ncbi:hypothetical protein [Pseudomonas sp. LRF_L74]|uniref:hypothetical protein n=1 Tax=Pseudomonas sp. LRF_L74 TaxID=3369422 RepID=UPI003F5F102E
MHLNPFEKAELQAPAVASRLPMYFMLAALGTSVLGFLINLATVHFSMSEEAFGGYLQALPYQIVPLACGAAMSMLGALLLSRYYLERHGVAGYQNGAAVLGLYVVLFVLLMFAWGYLNAQIMGQVYRIMQERHLGASGTLVFLEPLGWLYFAMVSLLPVWLSLKLLRGQARLDASARLVARWEPALAWALCVAVIYLKLAYLVPGMMIYGEDLWLPVAVLAGALLYAGVTFLAVWTRLAPWQSGLLPGKLILACIVALLMWLLIAVLAGLGLLFALYAGSDPVLPVLLYGLVMLALLWLAVRLSMRWLYRPQLG